MAKTIREERLRWILPIARQELRLVNVAKVCPHGKRSLERWLAKYKEHGESGLEPKSTEPKRYRIETAQSYLGLVSHGNSWKLRQKILDEASKSKSL